MKKYELIIFDCDGTLVDSEPLTSRLIAQMINELGIPISYEESIGRFAGKTFQDINAYISNIQPAHDGVSFEKEYRSRCIQIFKEELEPIPGVKELIEALNIPYCIASNGPKVKMSLTLPVTGLDVYFNEKNTFSAYEVQAFKPAPKIFQYAAEKMGVPSTKSLIIEDTWSGVMGAVNGNIDVWAFNPHLDCRLHLHGVPNFFSMSGIHENLIRHL